MKIKKNENVKSKIISNALQIFENFWKFFCQSAKYNFLKLKIKILNLFSRHWGKLKFFKMSFESRLKWHQYDIYLLTYNDDWSFVVPYFARKKNKTITYPNTKFLPIFNSQNFKSSILV